MVNNGHVYFSKNWTNQCSKLNTKYIHVNATTLTETRTHLLNNDPSVHSNSKSLRKFDSIVQIDCIVCTFLYLTHVTMTHGITSIYSFSLVTTLTQLELQMWKEQTLLMTLLMKLISMFTVYICLSCYALFLPLVNTSIISCIDFNNCLTLL